jgi:hypothetical protein
MFIHRAQAYAAIGHLKGYCGTGQGKHACWAKVSADLLYACAATGHKHTYRYLYINVQEVESASGMLNDRQSSSSSRSVLE